MSRTIVWAFSSILMLAAAWIGLDPDLKALEPGFYRISVFYLWSLILINAIAYFGLMNDEIEEKMSIKLLKTPMWRLHFSSFFGLVAALGPIWYGKWVLGVIFLIVSVLATSRIKGLKEETEILRNI